MTTVYHAGYLDDWLAFGKHRPEVEARIRRLNPDGLQKLCVPYGWNPHDRIYHAEVGTMSPRKFIARFGREAYRKVPRSGMVRHGHRKGIRHEYIEDFVRA